MIVWKATAGTLILFFTAMNSFFRALANVGIVTEVVTEELLTETEVNYRANIKALCEKQGITDEDLAIIREERVARMAAAA
tara:strand:+ start:106 stop:348 length:243 start_codon:yes stop_codon:yes gene_type:complete